MIKPLQTEEELQLNKLNGIWILESANDGQDRTDDFTNLVLTISGSFVQNGTYNYSFTGTRPNPSPWPRNGTRKFGSNKSTEIIRDGVSYMRSPTRRLYKKFSKKTFSISSEPQSCVY